MTSCNGMGMHRAGAQRAAPLLPMATTELSPQRSTGEHQLCCANCASPSQQPAFLPRVPSVLSQKKNKPGGFKLTNPGEIR